MENYLLLAKEIAEMEKFAYMIYSMMEMQKKKVINYCYHTKVINLELKNYYFLKMINIC